MVKRIMTVVGVMMVGVKKCDGAVGRHDSRVKVMMQVIVVML